MDRTKSSGSRGANRREFMSQSTRATVASAAVWAASRSRILGANERIQLGVIGPGVRGQAVLKHFISLGQTDTVALSDIYDVHLDQARELAGNQPRTYHDYRELLGQKDIDAVLIATPDHWHSRMVIDSCQAGKDVYIEKPLTYENSEGQEIVRAARIHDRVVQVGMQQRSGRHYHQARQNYFETGKLGKITVARTWWHGNTYHLRTAPFTEQPAGLDWKSFVGPRPWRDWDVRQFWNWRAYLDFGGGQITDLFTHWIDVVHWFMREDVPVSGVSAGGVYHYKDGRTAPDTIHVLLEYPGGWTATFEATLAPGVSGAGIEFIGTDGRLEITRRGYVFEAVSGETEKSEGDVGDQMTRDHVHDFLECVKSRRRPAGDVLVGHRSAQASHLGNVAYLERKRMRLDPLREEILGD